MQLSQKIIQVLQSESYQKFRQYRNGIKRPIVMPQLFIDQSPVIIFNFPQTTTGYSWKSVKTTFLAYRQSVRRKLDNSLQLFRKLTTQNRQWLTQMFIRDLVITRQSYDVLSAYKPPISGSTLTKILIIFIDSLTKMDAFMVIYLMEKVIAKLNVQMSPERLMWFLYGTIEQIVKYPAKYRTQSFSTVSQSQGQYSVKPEFAKSQSIIFKWSGYLFGFEQETTKTLDYKTLDKHLSRQKEPNIREKLELFLDTQSIYDQTVYDGTTVEQLVKKQQARQRQRQRNSYYQALRIKEQEKKPEMQEKKPKMQEKKPKMQEKKPKMQEKKPYIDPRKSKVIVKPKDNNMKQKYKTFIKQFNIIWNKSPSETEKIDSMRAITRKFLNIAESQSLQMLQQQIVNPQFRYWDDKYKQIRSIQAEVEIAQNSLRSILKQFFNLMNSQRTYLGFNETRIRELIAVSRSLIILSTNIELKLSEIKDQRSGDSIIPIDIQLQNAASKAQFLKQIQQRILQIKMNAQGTEVKWGALILLMRKMQDQFKKKGFAEEMSFIRAIRTEAQLNNNQFVNLQNKLKQLENDNRNMNKSIREYSSLEQLYKKQKSQIEQQNNALMDKQAQLQMLIGSMNNQYIPINDYQLAVAQKVSKEVLIGELQQRMNLNNERLKKQAQRRTQLQNLFEMQKNVSIGLKQQNKQYEENQKQLRRYGELTAQEKEQYRLKALQLQNEIAIDKQKIKELSETKKLLQQQILNLTAQIKGGGLQKDRFQQLKNQLALANQNYRTIKETYDRTVKQKKQLEKRISFLEGMMKARDEQIQQLQKPNQNYKDIIERLFIYFLTIFRVQSYKTQLILRKMRDERIITEQQFTENMSILMTEAKQKFSPQKVNLYWNTSLKDIPQSIQDRISDIPGKAMAHTFNLSYYDYGLKSPGLYANEDFFNKNPKWVNSRYK